MIEPCDEMRSCFLLCDSEDEAKQLINTYGVRLAQSIYLRNICI